MSICPKCKGEGEFFWDDHCQGMFMECDMCNGTGEVQMTNEEWFCTLPTEEKAEVFANATYSTALAPMEILALGKEFEQKKWEMWLKQPHKE